MSTTGKLRASLEDLHGRLTGRIAFFEAMFHPVEMDYPSDEKAAAMVTGLGDMRADLREIENILQLAYEGKEPRP